MNTPASYQMDGDGSLLAYPDHFKTVTPDMVSTAEAAETTIIETKNEIEKNFLKLAYMIDLFDQEQLFLARGYETLKAWAESPEIELGWRVVQDLLRIRREVIPVLEQTLGDRDNAHRTILAAGISKVRTCLPLLRDAKTDDFVDVVSSAPDLPWNDVRQEVKERRGLAAPLGEAFPVLFKAQVTVYEDAATITVYALDGTTSESIGKLRVKRHWLPRFEERFGKLIDFTDP